MADHKLPQFATIEELAEFVDTHDMTDYLAAMPEVEFDVDIRRETYLVPIDARLMGQIADVARAQDTPTEQLVTTWLKEKVAQAA